jgi:glucose-6-phosphate 1-dehydrogenase
MPILQMWEKSKPVSFPNYKSGTWGPKAANALITKDGRNWLQLTLNDIQVGINLKAHKV